MVKKPSTFEKSVFRVMTEKIYKLLSKKKIPANKIKQRRKTLVKCIVTRKRDQKSVCAQLPEIKGGAIFSRVRGKTLVICVC